MKISECCKKIGTKFGKKILEQGVDRGTHQYYSK